MSARLNRRGFPIRRNNYDKRIKRENGLKLRHIGQVSEQPSPETMHHIFPTTNYTQNHTLEEHVFHGTMF